MASAVIQRSFKNSGIFEKSLIIEMNEATQGIKKEFSLKTDILQPKDISYNKPQMQGKIPIQGSIASLESRAFVDQSENQPLTDIHMCRYDECHKMRQAKSEKANESPGSPLKNASLVLIIILFLMWIVIYTVLIQLKVI